MKKHQFNLVLAVSGALAPLFTPTRRLRFLKRGALQSFAIAALLLSPAASRAINFQFLYSDAAGQGFFDPVLGDQRRAAMDAGGYIIGSLILPTYVDETVNVRVTSTNDGGSNNLGSDRPSYFYDSFATSDPRYQTGTHYPKALANNLAGQDVDLAHDDMQMNINLGQNFYLGTDAAPPANQYDLVSVAVHELLHGLGFFDSFHEEGGYGVYGDGTYGSKDGVSGLPVIYDRFVTVGPGGSPLLSLNTANRQGALTGGNLYWNGANGIAGNGGAAPKLDASNPFDAAVNVAHIDATAFPNDIISEGLGAGKVKQTVSSVDRGMLRDMGWNISVFSSTVLWTPAGVNNRASTLNNWSQNPYPGDALTFGNNAAGVFDVRMDLQLYQLDKITFTNTAPAYTLRLSSFTTYDLTGFGIKNDSVATHTFVLESHQDEFSSVDIGSAAAMGFRNAATAGNSIFEVHGGFRVPQHTPGDHYDQFYGAQIDFFNTSTAASATFNIQGAGGDGAPGIYASVNFHNTSDAGHATVNNQPGRSGQNLDGQIVAGFGAKTTFYNTASANLATINNIGQDSPYPGGTGGITNFRDNSTAGNAGFHNKGATATGYGIGVGGATQFFDNSTAGTSAIINESSVYPHGGGNTYFGDTATAGHALIDNLGGDNGSEGPGTTVFEDHTTAANSVIDNRGISGIYGGLPGTTSFHDDSSAGTAIIHNFPAPSTGGVTEFHERSTAANAHIINEPGNNGGTIIFYDNSTAGSAHLDAGADGATGTIDFKNQSTAASAIIDLNDNGGSNLRLRFWDAASADHATITIGTLSNLQFYNDSTAGNANITMRPNSNLTFNGSYYGAPTNTADHATIHLLGGSSTSGSIYSPGGSALFGNYSTAANAQITVDGAAAAGATGGTLFFGSNADAGNATILLKSSPIPGNPGGALYFNGASGPLARIITEAGSLIYLVPNVSTSLGSIEGAGDIWLGSTLLSVGSLNTNTTFGGKISDTGGSGGSLTKTGTGAFTLTGTNTYTGLTTVAQGTLIVNGSIAGDEDVKNGATLKGTGSMRIPTVEAGGVFAPGNSPGTITVAGLNLLSGSTLQYELGLTRDHIVLTNSGNVALGGLLDLSILSGFDPALGQTFSLFEGSIGNITGTFSAVNAPIFNGHALNLIYGTNQVTLAVGEAGDFNGDGTVNTADYVVWRKGLGTIYTQADYNAWRAHIGQTVGSGAGATAGLPSSAVPEPATVTLFLLGFVIVGFRVHGRTPRCGNL